MSNAEKQVTVTVGQVLAAVAGGLSLVVECAEGTLVEPIVRRLVHDALVTTADAFGLDDDDVLDGEGMAAALATVGIIVPVAEGDESQEATG